MKFNEQIYQDSLEIYRVLPVNIQGLVKALARQKLEEKVKIAQKKIEDLLKGILSIQEVKEIILNQLKLDQISRQAFANDFFQEIKYLQERHISNPDVAIEKLIKCCLLQEGVAKTVLDSIINEKDFAEEMSREEREKRIAKLRKEVETLEKEIKEKYSTPEGYKGDFYGDQYRYIEQWRYIAPRFDGYVNAGCRWLNPDFDLDRKLIEIYNKLELGNIPKIRLRMPIRLDSKNYDIVPGYGHPFWEELEKSRGKI